MSEITPLASDSTPPSEKSNGKRRARLAARLARRWPWLFGIGFPVIFALLTLALLLHRPDFYIERLRQGDPEQAKRLSQSCLTKATRLASTVHSSSTQARGFNGEDLDPGSAAEQTEFEFQEAELNSWFAVDFEENWTAGLPDSVSGASPRIVLEKDRIRLAFQYTKGRLKTVVRVACRPWVPRPDVLVLEIDGVHCGAAPVPATYIRRLVEQFADTRGVRVEWRRNGRKLVARFELRRRSWYLQRIDVEERSIVLKVASGRYIYPKARYAPAAN